MTRNQTELTYLRASVQNASAVGLVIVLYDLLISDLRGAIEAIGKRDIEERSRHVKHAFLVIEQLEQSLDMENGGDAARNLSRFYAAVRANVMKAHSATSSEILTRQIELVFQVRSAWVQVDKPISQPAPQVAASQHGATDFSEDRSELATSWSA